MISENRINILFLAAGKGTRLKPITFERPKPLITVLGETLIGRLIRQFSHKFGSQSIWINISTMPQMLVESLCFRDIKNSPNFIWEPSLQGSASTVNHIFTLSKKPLLVVHSDLVLSNQYVERIYKSLIGSNFERNFLFCHTRPSAIARSIVTFDKSYQVLSFQQGPLKEENYLKHAYVNSGVYFFSCPMLMSDKIELGQDVTQIQIPHMIKEKSLYARIVNEKRISIDSIDALDNARRVFKCD
jgi:NDP-sugar pyrophosphorylase family protein